MIFAKANPPENQMMKRKAFHFSIASGLVLGWYKWWLLCIKCFSLDYQKKFALGLVCSFKLSDWFKNLSPLTQTNQKLRQNNRLAPANMFFDSFIQLSVSFMIGQSNSTSSRLFRIINIVVRSFFRTLTYNQAKRISPRGLGPDETLSRVIHHFCCSIDVSSSNPCCFWNRQVDYQQITNLLDLAIAIVYHTEHPLQIFMVVTVICHAKFLLRDVQKRQK